MGTTEGNKELSADSIDPQPALSFHIAAAGTAVTLHLSSYVLRIQSFPVTTDLEDQVVGLCFGLSLYLAPPKYSCGNYPHNSQCSSFA